MNPERHAFLLLPGFALSALAEVREALAAANEWLGAACYQGLVLSADGEPARAGCGSRVLAESAAAAAPALQVLHVMCDQALPEASAAAAPLHAWLRGQAGQAVTLAGHGAGVVVLAAAGLLDGQRAAAPEALVPMLAQRHPGVVFSQLIYEIAPRRLSCAGPGSSAQLMLAWLAARHGERLAQHLLQRLGLERSKARDERQCGAASGLAGPGNARLAEAVALMQANLGEPLPTEDIARLVGVSRRQLERLFKQHLGELPSRYYGELRLARARALLQQTSQSILQVALACGFASGSHFSNAYRARFGRTPRDERSQRAAAWRDQFTSPGDPG